MHRPFDSTGRAGGQLRQEDTELGVEQVAQSVEQASQVPLVLIVPRGHVSIHEPSKAKSEWSEHRVQFFALPMQELQLEWQAIFT